ncbi:S41 family peptidase [Sphingomonas adhaesiva]|uniref:S41 family peptidase n=1 Tax=Sphingomonas adhaesiva TaxID=28212 RepID=UPI002FF68765
MRIRDRAGARLAGALVIAGLLASCGGDAGGGNGSTASGSTAVSPTPTPSPTPTTAAGCTLRARQDWLLAQVNEWYLFPETLPTALDPSPYSDLEGYLDALTATARAQRKDRYFSYVTSVAEENAYYASGSTGGFGFRLTFDGANRLLVTEAFEGGPALNAGIDRGAEIVAVGDSAANMRTIASYVAAGNDTAFYAAIDPGTSNATRVFRISSGGTTRDVTLRTADFTLSPVSSRYGTKVIDDGGRPVGYVNLRTFIGTADDQLRSAFATFKARGITDVIVDLRYNGGGLVSTAGVFTDLLGGARAIADVQSYTTFRASKSGENETRFFQREAQAIAPTRVAFIGTGGTASASEYVINAMIPYLHGNAALIGSNTYGKPVGQIALDNPACPDDRLRLIAFALRNAAQQGEYYDGLATKIEASCQATDDLTHALGDPAEASTRAALDFLAGRSCSRIGASAALSRTALATPARRLVTPDRPTTAQRETPGLF